MPQPVVSPQTADRPALAAEGLFCPMCRSQVLVRPAAPTAQGFALDLSCADEYCLWTALMDVTWPELYPELTTLNPEPETRN